MRLNMNEYKKLKKYYKPTLKNHGDIKKITKFDELGFKEDDGGFNISGT